MLTTAKPPHKHRSLLSITRLPNHVAVMHDHRVPTNNQSLRISQPIRNRPRLAQRIPDHNRRRLASVKLINAGRHNFKIKPKPRQDHFALW